MASPQNAGYHWSQHFNSPKAVAGTAKRNPQLMAFAAGTGLASAGSLEPVRRNLSEKGKKNADALAAGATGAAAGQAAYQVAGYGTKKANAKVNDRKLYTDPKRRKGERSPEYKKTLAAHKKTYRAETSAGDYKNYQRNFPKNLPGARTTRVLGRGYSGKTGVALGTAATLAGAGLGIASRKKEVKKMSDPFEINKSALNTAGRSAKKIQRIKTQQGNAFKTYEGNIKVGQQKDAFSSYEGNISATKRRVRNGHLKRIGAAAGGGAAVGGAGAVAHRKISKASPASAFGVDHGDEFSKAGKDRKEPSTGRKVAGGAFGAYHGLAAGKGAKGKAKTAGTQVGVGTAGALGGGLAGSLLTRGSLAGAALGSGTGFVAGSVKGTKIAHKRGWLKPEGK